MSDVGKNYLSYIQAEHLPINLQGPVSSVGRASDF